MASLYPFLAAGAAAGQRQLLQLNALVWITVGEGQVWALTDYSVDVRGKVGVLGYKGDLNIRLDLLDQDPKTHAGPCYLRLNDFDDPRASYRVQGDALTVDAVLSGKGQRVAISAYGEDRGRTRCQLSGEVSLTTFITPAPNGRSS
jgi:hypothetical protein